MELIQFYKQSESAREFCSHACLFAWLLACLLFLPQPAIAGNVWRRNIMLSISSLLYFHCTALNSWRWLKKALKREETRIIEKNGSLVWGVSGLEGERVTKWAPVGSIDRLELVQFLQENEKGKREKVLVVVVQVNKFSYITS